MIENGVLLTAHPRLMFERVGGMAALERQLWTCARAGLKKLWVSAQPPDARMLAQLRLPPSLELVWSQIDGAPPECPAPYVAVSGDHFVRVETLSYVVSQDYPAPVNLLDAAGVTVLQIVPFRVDRMLASREQRLADGSSVYLESPIGRGPALGWLLALGGKSQDGFMARHFDRHLSLGVSRLLLDTAVTPNLMTVFSMLIGLAGALCFLQPDYTARLLGAVLVWLHSVLDGCDGELARIRFQESPAGRALDFWGDNIVHLAMFSCLALGFYKADQNLIPVVLGAASAVGTLGSAVLVYMQRQAPVRDGGVLARVEDFLAARDFIYLLLILAYFGRLYEFMWATAVGSLLFFGLTLYLQRGNNDQARLPHPAR